MQPSYKSFTDNYSPIPLTRCGRRSKRITGVDVREATVELETTTGTVVKVLTTGTVVQVFLLAHGVPADTWSGNGSCDHP